MIGAVPDLCRCRLRTRPGSIIWIVELKRNGAVMLKNKIAGLKVSNALVNAADAGICSRAISISRKVAESARRLVRVSTAATAVYATERRRFRINPTEK